ncbi:hypothetical protein KCU65_g9533, partial [Aureobasidium melanogenum]
MDGNSGVSRPYSRKLTRMDHDEDEFMTCTSFDEANDKHEPKSAVAIFEVHPSASDTQPVESRSRNSSNSPSPPYSSNLASSAQREHSDAQAPIVTSALSTPEKPATLDNAKVLLRKADKLLFGKMPRSNKQSEEDPEVLASPSSPWSSPSSNESENDLKRARGLLRAAHKMLELVGFKRNDAVWKSGSDQGEEGSPVRSTELSGDEVMDLGTETDVNKSHVAELQGRIRELEAQLRDTLADLKSEREVIKELREELRL